MDSSSDGGGQQQFVPQHGQGSNRLVSDLAREQTIATESETSDATAVMQCFVILTEIVVEQSQQGFMQKF